VAGHRNRLENNIIEDNGTREPAPGIRIRGETQDLVFRENIIRDTRDASNQTQTVGIRIEPKVGKVTLQANQVLAPTPIEDQRKKP